MIGCLPTQTLAFLAVFVYATHATQAIAFEWKPGLSLQRHDIDLHASMPASDWRNASDDQPTETLRIVSSCMCG